MKELIDQAYEMGMKAQAQDKDGIPHNNKEFMSTVPNCSFGDNAGVKLRTEMYKAYIKGWTKANLSQDIEGFVEDLSKTQVQLRKVN